MKIPTIPPPPLPVFFPLSAAALPPAASRQRQHFSALAGLWFRSRDGVIESREQDLEMAPLRAESRSKPWVGTGAPRPTRPNTASSARALRLRWLAQPPDSPQKVPRTGGGGGGGPPGLGGLPRPPPARTRACVLGPLGSAACQNIPFGVPKPAPRAELEACSDRTKIKEQRGRLALVVNPRTCLVGII
jgi:hypothetical protein